MKIQLQQRKQSGLSITVLLAFITFFVIGPLSMFVYELSRYNLASQQLKYCADSAALTAAASTTGSNASAMATVMTTAMTQAAYMFAQNSILDQPLSSTPMYTYGTAAPVMTPAANQAQLYFQFLDPVTKLPVAFGSNNGKVLQVTAAFGYSPVTSNFTHIAPGPYVITQQSDGGLPELDIVLCFDTSSSMDDFTNITLVNRWTPIAGKTTYAMATPHTGSLAQGPLYYAMGSTGPTGCGANATCPMEYENTGPGNYDLFYSANHGTHHGAIAPISSQPSAAYQYTDMVVNVDGTTNLTAGTSITVGGNIFTFPAADPSNLPYGILVEASRGNLESAAIANTAGIDTTSTTTGFLKYPGFAFQSGWFQAYYTLCMQVPVNTPGVTPIRRPIGDAIMAARSFFTTLNNDADVHFGIVTFSNTAGASPTAVVTMDAYNSVNSGSPGYISTGGYPNQDPINCPNPSIFLNKNPGPTYSNYDSSASPSATSVNGCVYNTGSPTSWNFGINTLVADGSTDIADALDLALAMQLGTYSTDPSSLHSGRYGDARPGATRAIVLFTDGMPTVGGDDALHGSWPASVNEAKLANQAGIPIYTIGLCLVASCQATQTAVLSDNTASYPNGIAGLSGHNATFAQTTDATQLTAIFQNVARQLVQLVRTTN